MSNSSYEFSVGSEVSDDDIVPLLTLNAGRAYRAPFYASRADIAARSRHGVAEVINKEFMQCIPNSRSLRQWHIQSSQPIKLQLFTAGPNNKST